MDVRQLLGDPDADFGSADVELDSRNGLKFTLTSFTPAINQVTRSFFKWMFCAFFFLFFFKIQNISFFSKALRKLYCLVTK